jgi:formylglycine-generating enzyme required for sulfatase activity
MTGNAWEWTRDRYQRDLYAFADSVDPRAPEVGRYCTIRGGGWYSGPAQLRIKNRHWFAPEVGEVSIGFRCVH